MSVAGQPDPRGARDAARWLRWALGATMSALLIVLVLLAAALLSLRRERPSLPSSRRTPPSVRSGAAAHAIGPQPTHSAAGRARPLAVRARVRHPHPPLVRIVERRDAPARAPLLAAAAEPPHPAPAPLPRPQRADRARRPWPPTERPLSAPVVQPSLAAPLDGPTAADTPEAPPVPITQPAAAYPAAAAADGVAGTVRLKVIVSRRGRVEDAIVVHSSGDDRLDEAAQEAVRRWRYRPARRAGQTVPGVDYALLSFYRPVSPR